VACEAVLGDRSLVAGDAMIAAHFDLLPTARAASQARGLVAEALGRRTAPAGAAELTDTAQLLVSELVTNGLMHARTELHLGISGDTQTLLFTVADGHPDAPDLSPGVPADFDYEESGRGMAIVVALASDFGWRRREDGAGKVMWFTLSLPTNENASAPVESPA